MKRKVTLSHRLEYAFTRSAGFLMNIFPLGAAIGFGALLGSMAWTLGVRRKVSLINISAAFPEKSLKEVNLIGRRSYANNGRFMAEFIRQARMGKKYFNRYITVDNTSALEKLQNCQSGVIGLGFHFGNWEYNGAAHVFLGKETTFLVGEQHNSLVDGYINSLRSALGPGLLTRDASMRGVIEISRKGGVVCWLSDQDAGRNGLVVSFFGKPASTPRGAAAFSVKLKMPIVCAAMIREKGPRQVFSVRAFLTPNEELPRHEAELDLTQRYTKVLEELIREHPDQYWWSHRRWKTTTDLYR
jgi:KDO2-lipid IV(A) lauroyltransferase